MTEDEAREFIRSEVARQLKDSDRVLLVPAAEVIRKDYLQRQVERTLAKLGSLNDDDNELMRYCLSQAEPVSAAKFVQVAFGNNAGATIRRYAEAFSRLFGLGLVNKAGGGGNGVPVSYRAVVREWIQGELKPHSPTDDEVEQVYQAVLGRIAGEVVAV